MSPHRALNLTTAAHPFAVGLYGLHVPLGLVLVFGLVGIKALEGLLLLPVVGLIMAAGGGIAVYAVLATTKADHKDPPMRLEQVAAWALAAVDGFFALALFLFYNWNTAVPTKVYVLVFAAVFTWRAIQLKKERSRLRVALAALVPAPPPLAERSIPEP